MPHDLEPDVGYPPDMLEEEEWMEVWMEARAEGCHVFYGTGRCRKPVAFVFFDALLSDRPVAGCHIHPPVRRDGVTVVWEQSVHPL